MTQMIENWKHFTLNELTKSDTAKKFGIDNSPDTLAVSNLDDLVVNVLDPLRKAWGAPIRVGSGYRCKELNKKVGGVKNSQHILGQAADIVPVDRSKIDRFISFVKEWCKTNEFDQCIIEKSGSTRWIHISYNRHRNRKKCFHLYV